MRVKERLRIGQLLLSACFFGTLSLTLLRPYMTLTEQVSHDLASLIRQAGYAIVLLVTAIAAWKERRATVVPWPLIAMLTWCLLSTLWAASPLASITKLVLTSIVIWSVFLSVDRLGVRRCVSGMQWILTIALVANYCALLIAFDFATHDVYGDGRHLWRGLMAHKNFAGTMAGITVIALALYGNSATRRRRYAFAVAAAVFLFFSGSRAALFSTLIGLATGGLMLRWGGKLDLAMRSPSGGLVRRTGWSLCAAVALALLFATLNRDWLLGIVKDPNLWSKRGEVWQPLLYAYLEQPFTGTGYAGYWQQVVTDSGLTRRVYRLSTVTQGHNGYLDLAIQVGLPGLLLALIAIIAWPISVLPRVARLNPQGGGVGAGLLTFFVINNVAETSLFDGDQMPQVFGMIAIAILVRSICRRNQAHTGGAPFPRSGFRDNSQADARRADRNTAKSDRPLAARTSTSINPADRERPMSARMTRA